MPWTTDDVEQHKKGLTPKQKRAWVSVANGALARCRESGGEDCEAKAIRQANAAAMQATETVDTFAVRESPTSPALHVYQPLGFAEPPEWAPFLPMEGIYDHPIYGPLDYSSDVLDQFVANFKSGVYQSRIPVNCEHDVQASGAVGWITDMRRADDGGVDVRVEWNDRGRALIEGDRFRYVSAEVYDVWTDPVSGEEIPNVAVGMAICTNPYFKESVLRPLAASEAVITRLAASEDASPVAARSSVDTGDAGKGTTMPEDQNGQTPTSTTTAPPVAADDDVKQLTERILAELGGTTKITDPLVEQFVQKAAVELHEAREREKQATDRAKALSEQNAVLTAQNRVKTFTDEVMGTGAQSGIAYVGHIPDMVRMLCSLANTYGDASWEVEHYKTLNRAHAEQIKAGSLFREIGTARGTETTQTAYDQIAALAAERAKASGRTFAQEFDAVLMSEHELRAAYGREHNTGGR